MVLGVHANGLHLWDITHSSHTPVLIYHDKGVTSAKFAIHARVSSELKQIFEKFFI